MREQSWRPVSPSWQLTANANFAYQYDDNGNLIKKTLLATGNYTQYTYDAENRLTQVQEFAAGNPTAITTSSYRYDGLGRRIEKVANGQTKRYIYDGEDILLEYDGSNVLQARYTHGPGIDEPIAVTKAGSTFYYHQDGLGTVTELTDSNGSVAKAYAYDAYGTILESPGTVEQPYTYTDREFDSESGLLYYRARYYDAGTGRFLQKDPIGIVGGDLNLYRYTQNAPVDYIDPSGLTRLWYDIKNKRLHVDPEQEGRRPYDLAATSGAGGCMNQPRCSKKRNEGPIPPGDYTINTSDLSNPDTLGDIFRQFNYKPWFFHDWGDWRVPIMPDKGTNTLLRGGFFLHGGSRPGSAGCIDVGGGIFGNRATDTLLFDLLRDPNHSIPLTVF